MPGVLTARQEIWRGVLYGQRSMLLRLVPELKVKHGLSVSCYEALLALWEAPDYTMTASELARSLLYTSGSASPLMARMADEGLVTRTVSRTDARVVHVGLTAAGRERVAAATDDHVVSLAREFDPLIRDDEVEVLLRFARRFAAHEHVVSAPYSSTT